MGGSGPNQDCQYDRVKASGVPNCLAARLIVDSGLNYNEWQTCLEDYHDVAICEFIKFGWPVGYHKNEPPLLVEENHSSATRHMKAVIEFVEKEIALGALVGPFKNPPFQQWTRCSPTMTRPKRESEERRVIVDLTFPPGSGVNAGIDITSYYGLNISYTLPNIGDLVSKLQECGQGALVWKADLARAYRQMRVDPLDAPLLGLKVGQCYYLDRCPAFGCKTSSAACQRLSNAVVYMLAKQVIHILAYLDDYCSCDKSLENANTSYKAFLQLANALGLKLSKAKCVPPTQDIDWLGYTINTNAMTISVPPSRLSAIEELCKVWIKRKRASKKMVQSIVGKLLFITNCIALARKFTARILAVLRSMQDDHWVTLASDFKADITWFLHYAHLNNGIYYYTPERPVVPLELVWWGWHQRPSLLHLGLFPETHEAIQEHCAARGN